MRGKRKVIKLAWLVDMQKIFANWLGSTFQGTAF
jgi:hypothetical protein